MDVDSVLQDIASNILEPNTQDEEINKLYKRGLSLRKDIGSDIVPKLKSLKEDKLYDIINFVEQLNYKLNKQYEEEVKRGTQLGVYDKTQTKDLK